MDVDGIVQALIPVVKDVIAGMLRQSDSGIIGGAREAGAITDYFKQALIDFEGNPVVEGLSHALQSDEGLQLPDLTTFNISKLLTDLTNTASMLNTIEGGDQVKLFFYGLAEHIAGAAGGGLFGRGQKISVGEQQMLDALRGQLGL